MRLTKCPVRWRLLKRAAAMAFRHSQLAQRRLIIEARRCGLPLQEHGSATAILRTDSGMLVATGGKLFLIRPEALQYQFLTWEATT